MALHVRQMAKFYGIPVVLNSLHCSKELLPWLDGMLEADEVSKKSDAKGCIADCFQVPFDNTLHLQSQVGSCRIPNDM